MAEDIFFLGWDVGPWKCTGKSLDALQLLRWRHGSLSTVGEPYHGNIFSDAEVQISLDHLLSKVRYGPLPPKSKVVLAIDAVFGWPVHFRHLVEGRADHIPALGVGIRNTQNKYLYRETERFLDAEFELGSNPPMTAVGGAIGSAATKAQFFLTRIRAGGGFYVPPLDQWDLDRARHSPMTIIEVYPGVTKKSCTFERLPLPTRVQVSSLGKSDLADALRAALVAACYARTLGIINGELPVVYTPADEDVLCNCDTSAFGQEGWIFTPRRGKT